MKGFNAVVWDVISKQNNKIELQYLSVDGEEGYPGNLTINVTYILTEDNTLEINYNATTDKATIINLTNHSYFNLSGEGDPYIGDHILILKASNYIPTDQDAIPYGKPEPVKNTPMDFTTANAIGKRINDDFEQLRFGNGYDHTFIIDKKVENEYVHFGSCQSPKTGIKMDMFTSQPGVQIYTGNGMCGNLVGKNNHRYPHRSAVCFETQHFPNSINNPNYPTTELHPGDTFKSKTSYKFSAVE
ncbi:MAG: aldose epimerase family protein [Tenuifilaceae bacterium]|nr:aldose epimerase family protein [Tenuifilaceae bacterium]